MTTLFDPFLADFDRITQRLFNAMEGAPLTGTVMPMDVLRRGDHVVVKIDLPGVQPDSVNVTLDGHVLGIEATRPADEQQGDVYFLRGRSYGTVRRQLTLPETLDVGNVEANYDQGVLTVTIPVAEHAKTKRIEVRSGAGAKQLTS